MSTLQELHDRATRGQPLTAAEQTHLDEWYAQQDTEENALINGTQTPQTIEGLQAQIKTALTQVAIITQQIQELMHQNEELRREVAGLKNQLTQRLTIQVA